MDVHKNARLTPRGREEMVRAVVEQGLTPAQAARRFMTTAKTVRTWVDRYRKQGVTGLRDRSSRPHSSPRRTPAAICQAAETLRRQRHTQCHIASALGLSLATVSRLMAARGLGRLAAIEPTEPRPRYERETPGELLHIDTKKLGRIVRPGHRVTGDRRDSVDGAGWEFAHVAIDDHSRVSFVQMHADERKSSAVSFLLAAVAHYEALGVKIKRLITDNGSAYRSQLFAKTCKALGIKHTFTKPYRPQTNGKAERFIQTCLREWAYGRIWANSAERTEWLPAFLSYYNTRRPHSALGYKTPASRLCGNNLLQLNT